MKPVRQTILPTEGQPLRGNCFVACLASVLELPLEDVPHVMHHEDWRERTQSWLATLGLGAVEVYLKADEAVLYPLPPGMFVIVTGKTNRHESRLHAVVAKTISGGVQWEYVHDPHPSDDYLTDPVYVMFLVTLDPAIARSPEGLAR